MLFNSVEFLVFFPIVIALYYAIQYKWRWLLLLAASYIFYGSWKVEFLSLIALSTLVDFYVGKQLYENTDPKKRWKYLLLSLGLNLGLLIFFKYGSFLANLALPIAPIPEWRKNQIVSFLAFDLPVGISFYTFQTMGYTIDIFKNKIKPEKHLGKFALYVSYFPQLVAGPIERFKHLQPQLLANNKLTYRNLCHGARLMLYGFFIKMVIADNIAPLVDAVFESPLEYSLITRWTGILGFGWQIYADFYGYSLIAIGAARCMGVELITNFKTPYFAKSIQDFWRRWHISLSTWFRDYIFVPLGGSNVNKVIWIRNILVVFILSGLWHGANYTFIIWGAIHGLFYLIERSIKVPNRSFLKPIHWLKTYLIVSFAWLFFRAEDISNAMEVLFGADSMYSNKYLDLPFELVFGFIIFIMLELLFKSDSVNSVLNRTPFAVRWSGYGVIIFFILSFAGTTNHPFIYFQF
ncbi:MAG: MBOAT family protein [Salibacteraceae bacterium]|nr:MBOAT family protein [Salibacteraceae bacterium]